MSCEIRSERLSAKGKLLIIVNKVLEIGFLMSHNMRYICDLKKNEQNKRHT